MGTQTDVSMDDDTSPLVDSELLTEMVRAFVEHPDKVRIEESTVGDHLTLAIYVDPLDRKLVIGKHGRMVTMLRTYFGVVAARQHKKITIEVIESEQERLRFRGPRPNRYGPSYLDEQGRRAWGSGAG